MVHENLAVIVCVCVAIDSLRLVRLFVGTLVPGLFAFSYIWVVDGGGDWIVCVPRTLAGLLAGRWTGVGVPELRAFFIPGYLFLLMLPLMSYCVKPKRICLVVGFSLALVHLLFVLGIILQDD